MVCIHSRFSSPFVRAHSPHSLPEPTSSPPEKPTDQASKQKKLKTTKKQQYSGAKKNNLSPSHYLPKSLTLSTTDNTNNNTDISSSHTQPNKLPPHRLRPRPSKAALPLEAAVTRMSSIKQDDTINLKEQAKGIFRRIFLSAKRNLTPAKPNKLTSRPSSFSSQRSRSQKNLGSQDSLNSSRPKISYPMKLHNSELSSFVSAQDPWEASVHASLLHRRATVRTSHSHARTMSCSNSRLSSGCPPSQESKRRSFNIQQRASKDSIPNPNPSLKTQQPPTAVAVTTSLNRSACTVRPKSAISQTAAANNNNANIKPSSFDGSYCSQRSHNHSFPPNRGSLYRHPLTRPLSLSHQSRRNSLMLSGDENVRLDGRTSTRRSSMASSNLTSNTSQLRQSWTTGRAILEPSPSQGPPALASSGSDERSSVITSGTTDQKSVSNSHRRPARNDWVGVIEEDITLTLMGCPQDQSPTTAPTTSHRASPPVSVAKFTLPPPTATPLQQLACIIPSPLLQMPLPSPSDALGMEPTPSLDASPQQGFRERASSTPPPPASTDAPLTSTSPSASTRTQDASAATEPLLLHVEPTPSTTPSSPGSVRLQPAKLPRPLSILFRPLGDPHLLDDPVDGNLMAGSDWYAELMTSVEQSISRLN